MTTVLIAQTWQRSAHGSCSYPCMVQKLAKPWKYLAQMSAISATICISTMDIWTTNLFWNLLYAQSVPKWLFPTRRRMMKWPMVIYQWCYLSIWWPKWLNPRPPPKIHLPPLNVIILRRRHESWYSAIETRYLINVAQRIVRNNFSKEIWYLSGGSAATGISAPAFSVEPRFTTHSGPASFNSLSFLHIGLEKW